MSRILDVFFSNKLVGYLTQKKSGQVTFEYSAQWLNDEHNFAISTSLPLGNEQFKQKQCRGFFAGILPEEYNRRLIARNLGISAQNDFAMLEKIGGECAGALTFLPNGTLPSEQDYEYQPLGDADLIGILKRLSTRPLLAGESKVRISLAGAQQKVAIHVDRNGRYSLPLGGAASTHILKPAIAQYPNIVSNETFCLSLARSIGIPAVNATVKSIEHFEFILVERYDRIFEVAEHFPTRLHQEDFCQALGIPSERKYQSEGGPGIVDCVEMLKTVSSLPAIDIQNFLNLVVFNLIIGNNDAHGKNFSLLFREQGGSMSTRLAPAYDVLSTDYYDELTKVMAMKIGKANQFDRLRARNFERLSKKSGISVAGFRNRICELAENIRDILSATIREFPVIHDLSARIDCRASRLIQAVKR
ncbi:MAG: type II toxin-antitoxin system HipA family toxin [Acidiferrobacterales bacterium]|nr:type II toxin-antitoxin system HipA family toxin [Acidiferrobacterales bacterium]